MGCVTGLPSKCACNLVRPQSRICIRHAQAPISRCTNHRSNMVSKLAAFTLFAVIVTGSTTLGVAQLGDSVLAFVGFNGTCDDPSPGSARVYAARADMDAATSFSLSWIVSAPAPFDITPPSMPCEWHVRPAVDALSNRLWHFVGLCAASGAPASSIVVSEWDVGAGDAPPTFSRACSFDAVSNGLDYVAFDARVFAAGPYMVNTTAGAADGRARVFGVTYSQPAHYDVSAVLPSCTLTAISTLDPVANVTGVFTADASTNPALPPILLHATQFRGPNGVTLSAMSPTSGALLWQANFPLDMGGRIHVDQIASIGLFDRRFVALCIADDGRFLHSTAVHGWAANASAADSTLMVDVVSTTNGPAVCAAITAWAPSAAVGSDWPLNLHYLSGENDSFPRKDGCRSGGTSLGPAYVLGFNQTVYPVQRVQLSTSSCPLPESQSCGFLSYAHGRPLIATMQGAYAHWDAPEAVSELI